MDAAPGSVPLGRGTVMIIYTLALSVILILVVVGIVGIQKEIDGLRQYVRMLREVINCVDEYIRSEKNHCNSNSSREGRQDEQ